VNLRTFAVRVEGDTLLVATAANPAIPRDA